MNAVELRYEIFKQLRNNPDVSDVERETGPGICDLLVTTGSRTYRISIVESE